MTNMKIPMDPVVTLKGVHLTETIQVELKGTKGKIVNIPPGDFDPDEHIRVKAGASRAALKEDDAEDEPKARKPRVRVADGPDEDEMSSMGLSELKKLPELRGVDTDKFRNKTDLINAILKIRQGDDDPDEDDE